MTGEALNAEQARSALRAAVPDLDRRERDQQIEVASGGEWYRPGQNLQTEERVAGLVQREQDALGRGYADLRVSGNCAWVSGGEWPGFLEYETLVQKSVGGRRMICLCSYCMEGRQDNSPLEIIGSHDMVVRSGVVTSRANGRANGVVTEAGGSMGDLSNEHELREALERQKRHFDLAMMASQMGTWRYTIADNICEYDENAQRLYGLTEARFLHDAEGAKAKFHLDDMEPMWSRVRQALDPAGDGRYDVEYRVKQLDGSWRWLSAWGLVEFAGEGADKKPIAIAGASRDLTEQKQAQQLQQLLLNELNHRVKNTLATVQAITLLTLRAARDLPSARESLDGRIHSMAQAHDLLTSRAWSGANLADIVVRALDAFTPEQVLISGPAVDVSPRHALALSLALHELATNATKYGALSCPEGVVTVRWRVEEGLLRLTWEEKGGPPVVAPTRNGFGSRLLEELLVRDVGGDSAVDYDPSGVRYSVTARR